MFLNRRFFVSISVFAIPTERYGKPIAMKRAHQLNLRFGLDWVYSSGSARFWAGFDGRISLRLIALRMQEIYGMLQTVKRQLYPNPSLGFA